MDATELRTLIATLPPGLAAWHAGRDALPQALQVLAMRRVEQLAREGLHPAMQAPDHLRVNTRSEDHFRHATSSLVTWSSDHLREDVSPVPPKSAGRGSRSRRKGRRSIARRAGTRDFEAACDLAWDWKFLETVQVGLATGDITVQEAQGRHVWLQNHRRADVEALDIILAQVTALEESSAQADLTKLRSWFEVNRGRPERIHMLPDVLRKEAWRDAMTLLEGQGTSIPVDTDLGGLTLGDARACYALLLAQLYLNEFCTIQLGTPDTLVWGIKPVNLTGVLAQYVNDQAAEAFVSLCRFVPGRSPVSAPLIPHGNLLLVPSALVSPIAFERTLLRAASADPSRSGQLGKVLGDRATRWAERLRSIEGCKVAERVKVKDRSGVLLGDLDVVAWDQARRLVVVFETKWPVDAATLAESYKVDSHFASGREQLERLRSSIASGDGVVGWPREWDPLDTETEFRWWVGSAQQLDSSPAAGADGIGSTSLRLVEQVLPQPDLESFVRALEDFPMPRQGTEFDLEPMEVAAGPYVIHGDALAIKEAPAPSVGRRTSSGWT